jgi:hypothetical protein
VIGSVRGEAARILTAAGALVVAPEDPAALAAAVRALSTDPARRAAMSRAGRAYVEAHFDRAELARRYRRLLLAVLAGADAPPVTRPGAVPPPAPPAQRATPGPRTDEHPTTTPAEAAG